MASLKDKLRAGMPTIGSWITIGHPTVAEILARAGFDWLAVDLEHSTIAIDQAGELIRTIDLAGAAPLVRLTSNDSNLIKRLMDAGAHGIIVPCVNSAEDARTAVAATRYPPSGRRGVGLGRAQGYGTRFEHYLAWQATEPVVIAQIEHRDAVKSIDAILATEGVDGFLIGPYDLSCSMGIAGQFQQAEFLAALKAIVDAGRRAGKPGGLHVVEPDADQLERVLRDGHSFVAYGVDFRFLDVSARSAAPSIARLSK